MSGKHTPGPWVAEERDQGSMIYGARGAAPVAWCSIASSTKRMYHLSLEEACANAELIAKAPEMAERIRELEAEVKTLRAEIYEIWSYEPAQGHHVNAEMLFLLPIRHKRLMEESRQRDDLLEALRLWEEEDKDELRRLDRGLGNMGSAAPWYVSHSMELRRLARAAIAKAEGGPLGYKGGAS